MLLFPTLLIQLLHEVCFSGFEGTTAPGYPAIQVFLPVGHVTVQRLQGRLFGTIRGVFVGPGEHMPLEWRLGFSKMRGQECQLAAMSEDTYQPFSSILLEKLPPNGNYFENETSLSRRQKLKFMKRLARNFLIIRNYA